MFLRSARTVSKKWPVFLLFLKRICGLKMDRTTPTAVQSLQCQFSGLPSGLTKYRIVTSSNAILYAWLCYYGHKELKKDGIAVSRTLWPHLDLKKSKQ